MNLQHCGHRQNSPVTDSWNVQIQWHYPDTKSVMQWHIHDRSAYNQRANVVLLKMTFSMLRWFLVNFLHWNFYRDLRRTLIYLLTIWMASVLRGKNAVLANYLFGKYRHLRPKRMLRPCRDIHYAINCFQTKFDQTKLKKRTCLMH